ncbi:hypothetical protein PF006_g33446, partial [Phytophthora fragariae]
YGRDDEDCKGLISDDEAFVGIDPSYIVPHNAAKLEDFGQRILFAANSTFFICGTGFSFDLKL